MRYSIRWFKCKLKPPKKPDSDLNEDNTEKKSEGMRKWLPNQNFEQSESDVDDPHFTSPNKTSTHEVATDCIDLTSDYSETQTTDSSTATTIPELPEYQEKSQKYSKDPVNNHLMARIVVKLVDEVPWDIDGNCKYLVKCCSENWLDKTKDWWWFYLRSTGKKDPNVERRVGHCQGSYVCKYEKCSKCTYENTINCIDFQHDDEGNVLCGPCGS